MRQWRPPELRVNNNGKTIIINNRYSETCVQVIDSNGKGSMLRALLDSGCSKSIILKQFTEKSRRIKLIGRDRVEYATYGGKFHSKSSASVGFKLIEFENKQQINYKFQVDELQSSREARYDMIIGSDLLNELGINIRYDNNVMEYDGDTIPMKNLGELQDDCACAMIYNLHTDSPILKEHEERQSAILDANYSKVDIDIMVDELDIEESSKAKLKLTLNKFPTLFGGGLGRLNIPPVSIELKKDAKPFQGRYYNIPKAFEQSTRKEIDRMCDIDVLRKLTYDDDSPWAAPSFAQIKKTGDVRILTDFRKMNLAIERKPFPLPRIGESIQKIEKFKSATALDLSQGYYSIPIDEETQKICTTVLPWGKYAYKRLAMGIACAPDIFQSIMMEILGDLDYVLVYIDDILIIQRENETEQDHLDKVETVLHRLQSKGFRANLRKSFFMQKEVEYLGWLLTTKGLEPQPKKIEAMKRIKAPKNTKQLKMFLGMVNFYRDLWPKRSETLAPLNKIASKTGKLNWKWTNEHQKAFEKAKDMLSKEARLSYPDFSKPFDLYTDASDLQLGATLVQEGKPLGFYTRKLNSAQMNYTVGEKELLGIVEGLKAFDGVVRGMDVTVHTDHLNLLYQNMPSQRMVRWRLMLEEFNPTIKHVAGKDNDAADALSRLEMKEKPYDTITWEKQNKPLHYVNDKQMKEMCYVMSNCQFESNVDDEYMYPLAAEREFADKQYPLDVTLFKTNQDADTKLQTKVQANQKWNNQRFTTKEIEGVELIHDNGKILVPEQLWERVLDWYHLLLVHPGEKRMESTIRLVYTWPGMRTQVKERCKNCHECQMSKKGGIKKYGLLQEKKGEVIKWSRVNVDLWGPKSVDNGEYTYQVHVMTMVDPVTGWFELAPLYGAPTAFRAQQLLDNTWLARYPRPREIGFDNGGEFMAEFKDLCNNMGLKQKPSLAWNPQSNAILERIHQVLADCIRSFNLEEKVFNEQDDDPFEEYLTAAAFSIRAAFHQTHGHSPAQMVFGRDMFMPVSADIDWEQIKIRKQQRIRKSNVRENSKRIPHTYKKGDLVTLEKTGIIRTLTLPRQGPYKVIKHHENGSITIEKEPFVTVRVNIRRVRPYYTKVNNNNTDESETTGE